MNSILKQVQITLILNALLISPYSYAVKGQASNGAIEDFTQIKNPEKSEAWIRSSVMEPEEVMGRIEKGAGLSPKEKAFLRNTHHGLYSAFDPWFRKSEIWADSSFEAMLKSQHAHTIIGRDGTQYTGHTPALWGLPPTKDVYPGTFRHEIEKTETHWVQDAKQQWEARHLTVPVLAPIPLPLIADRVMTRSDRLKQIAKNYQSIQAEEKVDETLPEGSNALWFNFINQEHADKHFVVDTIQFPELEPLSLSRGVFNQIYGNVVYHLYPEHVDQRKLIAQMGKVIDKIRNLSKELRTGKITLDQKTQGQALNWIQQYLY